MNDLEWLARNVSEWPTDAVEDIVIGTYGLRKAGQEPDYVRRASYECIGDEVTKQQWQQKREELGLDCEVSRFMESSEVDNVVIDWLQTGSFQDGSTEYNSVKSVNLADFTKSGANCPNCGGKISAPFKHGYEYTHKCGQVFRSFGNGLYIYGECLPKVGCKRQIKNGDGSWGVVCTVMGYDIVEKTPVAVVGWSGRYSSATADKLRSVKTKREKLIESAYKVILESSDAKSQALVSAERLYDAGLLTAPKD